MPKPTTITAVLKAWSLNGDRTVVGLVSDSTSRMYDNGTKIIVSNFKHMTHWPSTSHRGEYWVVHTYTGNAFKCRVEDREIKLPDN